MLPELPNLQAIGQFPILQQWIGLASLILVAFGIYVSIRKMNRDDRTTRTQAAIGDSPLANMPKYYLEGPIMKVFELLTDIVARLKRIEGRIDEFPPLGEDRRRRR